MLDWDEANIPRDIDGILALNPGWSRRDAAWKLLSLEQVDFDDARAAFSGNAPWDLRPAASEIASIVPTVWILPEDSRFVPEPDRDQLGADVGARAVRVVPDVGHSVHRDATEAFVEVVVQLGNGD